MQLLARSLRSFRNLFAHSGWFTLFVAVIACGLEVLGRHTFNDWQDMLAATVLAVLLIFVAIYHQRTPLPWLLPVTTGFRAIGSWLKRWAVEVGYDLRCDPPVKRGVPPIVFGIAGIFLSWALILAVSGDFFPHALRAFGVNVFYIGYLLVMMFVWGSLLLGIAISAYFTVGLIHDELTADGHHVPRSPSRAAMFLALASCLLLASRFVALWYVLAGSLVAWICLIGLGLIASRGDVRFLWRPRGSTMVRSLSAPLTAAIIFGLATAFAINLSVTAAGSAVWADPALPRTSMPLTITLGSALGWFLLTLLWVFVWQAVKERLRSPARRTRRILHVRGPVSRQARRHIARHFPWRSWRVDYDPWPVHPCAVTIELVEPARSEAREFDPDWPLKISLDDLDDADVRDRIERRSDIQVRRRIVSGLERLFKVAKRRKYRGGHGYWVAPHLQLWNGLRRDEPEPEPIPGESPMVHDNIGPAYHRVFPLLARHLFYRTMRSLHLDLIFVEDGVTFRRLARVMRRLFELHDKQPGQPADDKNFVGLPGTKAIVYEFQFDNPYESETYPEPKFTTLGRARILLVFRDRSEHDELVEPPFDFSRTPVGMAGG